MDREGLILDIPNVSFINDDSVSESENAEALLAEAKDSEYIFCCGDIFTKMYESDFEIEWGCKNSFMKISVDKGGCECFYGEAYTLPNNIMFYE